MDAGGGGAWHGSKISRKKGRRVIKKVKKGGWMQERGEGR